MTQQIDPDDLDALFCKDWNRANDILKEMFVKIQFPEKGPENNINNANPDEAEVFKDWVYKLEDMASELYGCVDDLVDVANKCQKQSRFAKD